MPSGSFARKLLAKCMSSHDPFDCSANCSALVWSLDQHHLLDGYHLVCIQSDTRPGLQVDHAGSQIHMFGFDLQSMLNNFLSDSAQDVSMTCGEGKAYCAASD